MSIRYFVLREEVDKVATPEHSTNLQEDIKGDAGQSVLGRHRVYGTRVTRVVA